MGGVGGATLVGLVWGATLGGVSGKSGLGSACSKLSSGVSIGMGVDRGGQVCVKISRCGGISIWGVAAASANILLRRVISLWWDSWRRWGKWPLIAVIRFPAAAMMESSRAAAGFEIYLCLWKTVADTWVAWVFIIQIFHAR